MFKRSYCHLKIVLICKVLGLLIYFKLYQHLRTLRILFKRKIFEFFVDDYQHEAVMVIQ